MGGSPPRRARLRATGPSRAHQDNHNRGGHKVKAEEGDAAETDNASGARDQALSQVERDFTPFGPSHPAHAPLAAEGARLAGFRDAVSDHPPCPPHPISETMPRERVA